MSATLAPYLKAVRSSLTASMCIQNFDSQVHLFKRQAFADRVSTFIRTS